MHSLIYRILKHGGALICAVALLSGCGGAGADDTPAIVVSLGDLSKDQFIAKADAACVKERTRIGKELLSLGTKRPRETLEVGRETVLIPGLLAHAEAMQKLGAPRGDVDEVQALVDAMVEAIDEVRDREVISFKEVVEPFDRYNRLAEAYGLKSCQFH